MRPPKTFILTGISSILCFMIWANAKTTQTAPTLNYQNLSSNSNVAETELKGVRFEPKSALHGLTKEHFRFSSETWEASDGVPIFLRREYCGSPKNAEKALRETVKTAFSILETRTVRNRHREITGRRIVATNTELPRQRVIFWTNGEMLYTVESSSFAHALLFEKMFPGL
jgi:hypothetical protein